MLGDREKKLVVTSSNVLIWNFMEIILGLLDLNFNTRGIFFKVTPGNYLVHII
jgi:hypothetical protein